MPITGLRTPYNLYSTRTTQGVIMWRDQIIEELHKVREEYARQFNFDINAICKDFQEKQAQSGREVVSFPPHKPVLQLEKRIERISKA
jgi:hypothetical protein